MAKISFIAEDGAICSNAVSQDVDGERLTRGVLRCIQRMVCDTGSTQPTLVKFGLKLGTHVLWLGSVVGVTALATLDLTLPVWATGDYVPFVRVYGGTLTQPLTLHTYGFLADNPE